MVDSFRHKGMRKKLVEELAAKGINDARVLDAINSIPRHQFLDTAFVNFAYQDKAFPIGAGQTISQPYIELKYAHVLMCLIRLLISLYYTSFLY